MNHGKTNSGWEFEVRAARIPWIGWLAWHHWVVIRHGSRVDRWEVWPHPDVRGESWGHLHRNLLPPERGVGAGDSWVVRTWYGREAAALAERVAQTPNVYPYRSRYHYWPGPNSNTFVQWVLAELHPLGRQAPGRRYGRYRSAVTNGP